MRLATLGRIGLVCAATAAAWLCPSPALLARLGEAEPTLDELLKIDTAGDEPSPQPVAPPLVAPDDEAAARRNPMAELSRQMRSVSQRLGRDLDPGLDTQRLQESILARLDQLIQSAERAGPSQSSSSSGGGTPQASARRQDTGSARNTSQAPGQKEGERESTSASASGNTANPGRFSPGGTPAQQDGAVGPLRQSRVEWGNLPPRLRDEVSQGVNERSSALYRRLTDAYFRRLAEESK